jgi:hypothetical protein
VSSPLFFPGLVRLIVSPLDEGLNLVSTTTSTRYNVLQEVSPQKAASWKIIAYGISSSVAVAFKVLNRVHVKGGFVDPGIVRPVVWPIDTHYFIPQASWEEDFRLSAQKRATWRDGQRRSARKIVNYNVYDYEFASRTINWNDLLRIRKPGVTVGFWVNEILTPIVHPFSEQNFSPNPSVQWTLKQRLKLNRGIRFNIRVPASVQKRTTWNTNGIHVVKQLASNWVTRQQGTPKVVVRYRTPLRIFARKKTAWSVNNPVSLLKAAKWRTTDPVSKSAAVAWTIRIRRNKPVATRWNTLYHVRTFQQTLYSDKFRISLRNWHLTPVTVGSNLIRPIVWPVDVSIPTLPPSPSYGIVRSVVFPVSYPFFASYGQQATPGITWRTGINPAGRVNATKAITFNVRVPVVSRNSSAWTTVGRRQFKILSQFNTYNLVTDKTIIEWTTGTGVSGFIRQTSQQRTDFAF